MMGLWFLFRPAAILVCGLASVATVPARAAPLDPLACEQLQLKLDELRKAGVETDMALGIEKARTTLPIERFNRIGVFIETDEQLNFRCGLAKQRIVLPTTIEGGEEEIPAPAEATGADTPGTPPPRASRATKDAAAGKGRSATKAPAAAPKRRPAVAKAKDASAAGAVPAVKPASPDGEPRKPAKKKAAKKPDDAYRPTPKPVAGSKKEEPATKQ
jgi:hypothetical protein